MLIEALHKIVALSDQAEAKMLARLIVTRIGLSVALRLHPASGRLAPPHCRAYFPALVCGTTPEAATFSQLIADGKLPHWLAILVDQRPMPMQVTETSDAEAGVVISSTLDPDFSIGVASQELATQSNRFISNQSNVFAIHYARADDHRPGVVFSRYLINDKWLGDYRTTPSRANNQVFRDEGSFRGVLAGSRAIGLYTSPELDAWSRCFSAKSALIWSRADDVDEIWVNGSKVDDLPAEVPERSTLVFACGEVYIVVRPLERTRLGVEAPIRIVEHRGCLALEMYNYLGPPKTFWELGNPGAFFQGNVRNGFFVEVLSRNRYGSGQDLCKEVADGYILETLDDARTYDGGGPRKWAVTYERDNRTLGIEVDLMRWRILRRWADGEDYGFPMLSSPVARQSRSGDIELGNARLRCGNAAAWLVGLPEADLWAAACHGSEPSAFTLELPAGRIHAERLTAGLGGLGQWQGLD